MAPLSRQLCGLLLPHDRYGTHLDASRHTVDETLERKNFQYAGEALAEVWSNTIIDKFPVVAEYVKPTGRGKNQNARFYVYVNIFFLCERRSTNKKSVFFITDDEHEDGEQPLADWLVDHVRQSQYLLQIVKCCNPVCCDPFRSNLLSVLPTRFLPPPVRVQHEQNGQLALTNVGGRFLPLYPRLVLQMSPLPTGL